MLSMLNKEVINLLLFLYGVRKVWTNKYKILIKTRKTVPSSFCIFPTTYYKYNFTNSL